MAIGNIVKRVLFIIREEYSTRVRSLEILARKSETSLESLVKGQGPLNLTTSISELSLSSSQGGDTTGIGGAPDRDLSRIEKTVEEDGAALDDDDEGDPEHDSLEDEEFVIGEDLTMDGSAAAPAGNLLSPPIGRAKQQLQQQQQGSRRAQSTSPHLGELMPGRELSQVDLSDLSASQPSLQGLISRARDSEADFSK